MWSHFTLLYLHPSTTEMHLFTHGLKKDLAESRAWNLRNFVCQSVCLFACWSICVVICCWPGSPQWSMIKNSLRTRRGGFPVLVLLETVRRNSSSETTALKGSGWLSSLFQYPSLYFLTLSFSCVFSHTHKVIKTCESWTLSAPRQSNLVMEWYKMCKVTCNLSTAAQASRLTGDDCGYAAGVFWL